MDKHIAAMREALREYNAVAREVATRMEENNQRYQPDSASKENARLKAILAQMADNTRQKISSFHSEALAAVDAWGKPSGGNLDTDDMALLSGAVPLSSKDLRAMVMKHEGNRTMLSAVEKYAQDHGLTFALGYVPSPTDKAKVYSAFNASALSLLNDIQKSSGVSESLIASFGDSDHVSDPAYLCVLEGLSALQERSSGTTANCPAGTFDFHFKPLPGREKV